MFPRSEILIERESKAEFVLGRVESPGFQHTAVLLGCVEPSGALLHLLPTIIEIPHTLVDIYQSGALLLVRVESPIAAHSSSTGWRGVALPGTVFVDGGVMSSYHIDVPEIGNTYRERIEG